MNTRKNNDSLFVALSINDIEKLKAALMLDVDLQDKRFGDYPLTMAAKKKRWRCVRLIAEHPNKKYQNDLNVALMLAVTADKYKTASVLLKAGADVDFMSKSSDFHYDQWTPIFEGIKNDNHKMVGLLYYGAHLEQFAYCNFLQICNVLDFAGKIGRNDCLWKGWDEYNKLKAPDELVKQEKEIIVIIAQGLRQRESYIVKFPIETIADILKLAGETLDKNKFHKNVLKSYDKLNYISFNFVVNNYDSPRLFSNFRSKALVAKISDGIKQEPVDFYKLFQRVEKYLNRYLNEKKLTLDKAAEKSPLIGLLKKFHIADSPEISWGKNF
jgi:hypothetical protein